jgi:hypothetical protein
MVAFQSLLEENQLQALPTSYQGVSLVSQSVESAAPIPIIQFVGYLKLREVVSSPKAPIKEAGAVRMCQRKVSG